MAEKTPVVTSKKSYMKLLDHVLRTNPQKKATRLMEAAVGVKMEVFPENQNAFQCSLSKAIKYNKRCIESLHQVSDNLVSAFMDISDSWKTRDQKTRQLIGTTGNIMNLVIEAVSLSRKIHENSLGLHVAVDFLRKPENDVQVLDFSKKGRIPAPHYSCNEATTMCLTWLHTTSVKLMRNLHEDTPKTLINIYSSFKEGILDLRDSSQLASQVFRVLLYCNTQGKKMLREYLKDLKPQEINDIITELQTLRRQFDHINILLERLGRSLADVWARCTGTTVTFEELLQTSQESLKNKLKEDGLEPENNVRVKVKPKTLKKNNKASQVSFEEKGSGSVSTTKKKSKKDQGDNNKGQLDNTERLFFATLVAVLGGKSGENHSTDRVMETPMAPRQRRSKLVSKHKDELANLKIKNTGRVEKSLGQGDAKAHFR